MNKREIKKYIIKNTVSIRETIKYMDLHSVDSLIVVDDYNLVVGVFTSGDFRNAVLSGIDINDNILTVINKNYKYLNEDFTKETARAIFNAHVIVNFLPVINANGELVDIAIRDNFYTEIEINNKRDFMKDISAVIMAGGKGTRLDPFTRVLPKPLIPIGNEPIIRRIMDKFNLYGIHNFYISINDKGKMIKAYFYDHVVPYSIRYIEENKPLGTAGSLKLINDKISKLFIVTNCDILLNTSYSALCDYHISNNYDLTIVASMQSHTVPYGVCVINNDGDFNEIIEKPKNDYLVNAGVYVINPRIFSIIQDNENIDMTDLIKKSKNNGYKIGIFPVSEKSWFDIGQWDEYDKAIKHVKEYNIL